MESENVELWDCVPNVGRTTVSTTTYVFGQSHSGYPSAAFYPAKRFHPSDETTLICGAMAEMSFQGLDSEHFKSGFLIE